MYSSHWVIVSLKGGASHQEQSFTVSYGLVVRKMKQLTTKMLGMKIPGMKMLRMNIPGMKMLRMKIPGMKMLGMKMLGVKILG